MSSVEQYSHRGTGYNPYLITPGWQVAQLNYAEAEAAENIVRLDVHHDTDEAFYLIKGGALLAGAEFVDSKIQYDMQVLKSGIVYNIRKGSWHTIVMEEGAEVLIIENENTHLNDCEFHYFTAEQKQDFLNKVNQVRSTEEFKASSESVRGIKRS